MINWLPRATLNWQKSRKFNLFAVFGKDQWKVFEFC